MATLLTFGPFRTGRGYVVGGLYLGVCVGPDDGRRQHAANAWTYGLGNNLGVRPTYLSPNTPIIGRLRTGLNTEKKGDSNGR